MYAQSIKSLQEELNSLHRLNTKHLRLLEKTKHDSAATRLQIASDWTSLVRALDRIFDYTYGAGSFMDDMFDRRDEKMIQVEEIEKRLDKMLKE